MSAFSLYDVVLGSGLTLRQVLSTGLETGANIVPGYFSAGLDPQELYGGKIDQRLTLQTSDLVGLLGGVDPQAGLSVTDGIVVPLRQAQNQGTYATGANHYAAQCTNGLVVVEGIDCTSQQTVATARATVHCRSADGTDPVTHSAAYTLAAQAYNAQFGMGPVVLTPTGESSFNPDINSVRIGTGITVRKRRDNGLPAPTRVWIRRRAPFIDLGFASLGDLATFASVYDPMTSVVCYLRRYADGDTFEADASLLHAALSFATGIIHAQRLSANGIEDAAATVRLWGKTLSWSVVNAIP